MNDQLLFLAIAAFVIWRAWSSSSAKTTIRREKNEEARPVASEEELREEEGARRERMARWYRTGPTQEVLDEMKLFRAHVDWRSPAQFAEDWNRVERIRKQERDAWLAAEAEEGKHEFHLFGQRYHNPFRHN
jgi:hypothetical protein